MAGDRAPSPGLERRRRLLAHPHLYVIFSLQKLPPRRLRSFAASRAAATMTLLRWAVVFVLSLSFMVFVTFFGRLPALR